MANKIVVPAGMLKAAGNSTEGVDPEGYLIYQAVKAALQWLAENPIVPNESQAKELYFDKQSVGKFESPEIFYPRAWQRRMFLAPEPESGFIECDTCRVKSGSPTLCRGCLHNREVIEGFLRRGQKLSEPREQ